MRFLHEKIEICFFGGRAAYSTMKVHYNESTLCFWKKERLHVGGSWIRGFAEEWTRR
jgi:hypothetical protein